ncbi:PilZ domain-containing protein [Bdellovibrionota bacterium FG-1]
MNSQKNRPGGGAERRRSNRRPILRTFSLFVVVPQKGIHRLEVHNVSEQGLSFDLDTEGEDAANFPLKESENLEIQFYLNQSLFLPLSVRIVRAETTGPVRRVGVEIVRQDKASEGFKAFIQMLDQVADVGQIVQG